MIEKKGILFCVLLSLIALTSGCETTKGVAQGVGKGMVYTIDGAASDTKNLFQAIIAVDSWMKENLW